MWGMSMDITELFWTMTGTKKPAKLGNLQVCWTSLHLVESIFGGGSTELRTECLYLKGFLQYKYN